MVAWLLLILFIRLHNQLSKFYKFDYHALKSQLSKFYTFHYHVLKITDVWKMGFIK